MQLQRNFPYDLRNLENLNLEFCNLEILKTTKFLKYPDTINIENANLDMFKWMNLHDFEIQPVEL